MYTAESGTCSIVLLDNFHRGDKGVARYYTHAKVDEQPLFGI